MAFLRWVDCISHDCETGQQTVFGHHLDEGPFCLRRWRNPSALCPLPHIPSTQRTCCCEEHSSPGHGSPGVLRIAKLHHPLSGWWHSTAHIQLGVWWRQKGLSPPSSSETLWNVSFPCGLQALSFQSPRTCFWLLASFSASASAQQEVAAFLISKALTDEHFKEKRPSEAPVCCWSWGQSLFSEL